MLCFRLYWMCLPHRHDRPGREAQEASTRRGDSPAHMPNDDADGSTNPPRSVGSLRAVTAGSAVLGPCGAWLYESGRIDWFGQYYSLNLWIVVALAMCGVVIGVYAVMRGAPLVGIGTVVINSGVAALYGFLGLFFGLGGSR